VLAVKELARDVIYSKGIGGCEGFTLPKSTASAPGTTNLPHIVYGVPWKLLRLDIN